MKIMKSAYFFAFMLMVCTNIKASSSSSSKELANVKIDIFRKALLENKMLNEGEMKAALSDRDINKESLLIYASKYCLDDLVEQLLLDGVNPNADCQVPDNGYLKHFVTPLSMVCCFYKKFDAEELARKERIAQALINKNAKVNLPIAEDGLTPLMVIAKCGRASLAKLFIDAKANVNEKLIGLYDDRITDSVLSMAICAKSLDIAKSLDMVKLLIDANAELNDPDWMSHTPIGMAITAGDVEMVRLLVNTGKVDLGVALKRVRNLSLTAHGMAKCMADARKNAESNEILKIIETAIAGRPRLPSCFGIRHARDIKSVSANASLVTQFTGNSGISGAAAGAAGASGNANGR